MRRFTRHFQRQKPIVDINMTPLMDLTFMLLIIFIITVPVLDYSTDVTPPRMTTDKQMDSEESKIVVTLNAEGVCDIDGVPTSFVSLEEAFRSRRADGIEQVYLRADGSRPLEDIVAVMRAAKNAHMKISLMTQAE